MALLNEPTFTEAAEGLANRLINSHFTNDDDAVNWAFEASMTRAPTDDERRLLIGLLNTVRSRLSSSTTKEAAELNAWKQLARTIVNLEEFIVRE